MPNGRQHFYQARREQERRAFGRRFSTHDPPSWAACEAVRISPAPSKAALLFCTHQLLNDLREGTRGNDRCAKSAARAAHHIPSKTKSFRSTWSRGEDATSVQASPFWSGKFIREGGQRNKSPYCWGIWEFASAMVSLFTCRERAPKRGYPR